jgi:hypothetical protein
MQGAWENLHSGQSRERQGDARTEGHAAASPPPRVGKLRDQQRPRAGGCGSWQRELRYSGMEELRSYAVPMEPHLAAGRLQARGIPCEVRDNTLSEEAPFVPTLWILRDTDLRAAVEILSEKPDVRARPWSCPKCRSENELQFDACWSCGADRPRP